MRLPLAASLSLIVAGPVAAESAATLLPAEWSLSPPPGPLSATGTLPASAALTASGAHLVVVEAGAGPAAIRILDPITLSDDDAIGVVDLARGKRVAGANVGLYGAGAARPRYGAFDR